MTKKTWEETWGTLEKDSFWRENTTIEDLQNQLDNGADIDATNQYGSSALSRAVELDRTDLLEFLLGKGCSEETINYALYRAADCGALQSAKVLLDAGADPNYELFRPNHDDGQITSRGTVLANARNILDDQQCRMMSNLLLEYGADPTEKDFAALERYDSSSLRAVYLGALARRKTATHEAFDWLENHPNPSVRDFLSPMGCSGQNVITALVRAGSHVLEMAFPLDKWATIESMPALQQIFDSVPREKKLMDTMRILDNKLKATYNLNKRRKERQRRDDLADMLLALDDPALRRKMDDKMRQKWGLKKLASKKGKGE